MTLTPGRRRMLALLLGWASVALLLFTLSRPVRAWAGHHWDHLLLFIVIPLAVIGVVGAVGLWKGGGRPS